MSEFGLAAVRTKGTFVDNTSTMETPEKKSEFAKRVLFGASKAAAVAAGNAAASERPAGSTRSGSQSSTSSAPGPSIYSLPVTPRTTHAGEFHVGCCTPASACCVRAFACLCNLFMNGVLTHTPKLSSIITHTDRVHAPSLVLPVPSSRKRRLQVDYHPAFTP